MCNINCPLSLTPCFGPGALMMGLFLSYEGAHRLLIKAFCLTLGQVINIKDRVDYQQILSNTRQIS